MCKEEGLVLHVGRLLVESDSAFNKTGTRVKESNHRKIEQLAKNLIC